MLSESVLVRALDFNPLSTPKIERTKKTPLWMQALVVVLNIFSCVLTYLALVYFEVIDIELFVWQVNSVAYYLLSLAFQSWILLTSLSDKLKENHLTLEELNTFDNQVNVTIPSHFNFFIWIVLVLAYARLISLVLLVDLWSIWVSSAVGVAMYTLTTNQVICLKYMISSRYKVLIDRFKNSEPEDQTHFENARLILRMNRKIEEFYSFPLGISLLRDLTTLFMSALAFWRVYGVKNISEISFERDNPVLAIFLHQHPWVQMAVLSMLSTTVTNQVFRKKLI